MKRATVSLCVIARDEEATIGSTIKSVLALVDEVVVVDTGSQDNTRIIAEGYGARVVDVPWEDDFSAARNAALEEAVGDWVLVLDADEYLQPVRPVDFQRLLHESGVAGFRLQRTGAQDEGVAPPSPVVRLFRRTEAVRWQYPIYEQIEPSLRAWAVENGLTLRDVDLNILHDGARQDRRLRSRDRNQRLLRRALITHPQEPYFPYRLGRDGLSELDDEVLPTAGLHAALGHLNLAWQKVGEQPPSARRALPWLPDLGARISSSLLALDRLDEARTVMAQVAELFPDDPKVLLQGVAADLRLLQERAADLPDETTGRLVVGARTRLQRLQAMAAAPPPGVDSRGLRLYPLRYLGELALVEGRVSEAVSRFEEALGLDPNYSFAWLGMAECSRFAGDEKRALKLYLRTVTDCQWNHRAWLRGCGLMHRLGFVDNAQSWRLKVALLFPEHPSAGRDAPAVEPTSAARSVLD